MNKYYLQLKLALCSMLIMAAAGSYAQSFSWIQTAGNNNRFTWGQTVTIDHHHNEVTCGYQNDSTHFGSTILPFYGDFDAYIAKYDSLGNVLWVRTVWGPNAEKAYRVAVDTADNIYVIGECTGPYTHFTATDSMAILAGGGNKNFFLAKYDKDGNFQWAREGGNPAAGGKYTSAYAVTVDPIGDVVIGGYYQDTMVIGTNHFGGGTQNLFLAKYSATGTCTWAKSIRSNGMCWVSAIACDDTGNIYPTGKFGGPLYIGSTKIASNPMGDAVFFGKFNSSGTLRWMDSIINNEAAFTSDNNFHSGNSIVVDHSGNVYIGGSLLDSAVILSSTSSLYITQDGFIAKYNNAGAQLWMQRYGDNKRDVINGLALDASGGLYAIGNFVPPATIGGMALTLPSWGYGKIFVGKFDPNTGNAIWLKTGGGLSVTTVPDYGLDISVDQQTGSIATTGYFEHQIRFESLIVTSASTALGYMDMYLTRQTNAVLPLTVPMVVHEETYELYPNPASDLVHVALSSEAYHKVYIIDMGGHTVKETETNSLTVDVDVHSLAPGSYTIAVADAAQNVVCRKLVKQ